MPILKFITAGESHGKALTGIIEGIPSNLALSSAEIDRELKRRQSGFGRGGRMQIETDHAEIISGVRWGRTIGSPITLLIENRDHKNWLEGMSADESGRGSIPAVTRPRPGHADLGGAIKYNQSDLRNILERSSARETAMRVALGAIAKRFLLDFGIKIGSYVVKIGNQHSVVTNSTNSRGLPTGGAQARRRLSGNQHLKDEGLLELFEKAESSPVRCPDEEATGEMVKLIEKAIKEGNSLGGVFEIFVTGLPEGIGSHIQWDRKLDGRLAQALMSIQATKGVEVGLGFGMAEAFGSEVMDEIYYKGARGKGQGANGSFYRKTNNAGGIEGGMTNGMPVLIRAAMKPIPTLRKPLNSVDIITKGPFEAAYERSDVCAVPAASVVGEAMTALTIATAFLEKFGGDSMEETRRNHSSYLEQIRNF